MFVYNYTWYKEFLRDNSYLFTIPADDGGIPNLDWKKTLQEEIISTENGYYRQNTIGSMPKNRVNEEGE